MEDWKERLVPGTQNAVSGLRARLEQVRDAQGRFDGKTRARAASAIGRLGDPRPGVGLKDGLPDIDWVDLPAGKFRLGETGREAKLEKPFRLSRYPVTVAQFQAFVDAGGYREDGGAEHQRRLAGWWSPEGLKWKRETNITGPEDSSPAFQTPNHPRVGVSWFEASAYCRWLTEQFQARALLKAGEEIRLPDEAEWEWAARWNNSTGKADDRRYPWGNPPRGEDEKIHLAQHCNCRHTGIGHTSAVGLFPSGQADCGVLDLSGNVWEWCENRYDDKSVEYRVLRGGSWVSDDPARLSCAVRRGVLPGSRDHRVGFRVVVVCG
jgi:formylglycine-generating enzyme required for sulfatase activity